MTDEQNISINIDKKMIEEYCVLNNIKKLSLFGSRLKNTFSESSDIDLLVEFEEGNKYGLLDIARMERELSEIIGIQVDLRTPEELSKYFRDSVVKEAQLQYGK